MVNILSPRTWLLPILLAGFPTLFFLFNLLGVFANGAYEDSGQMLGGDNSFDVALADLDADGDLDAYVANQSSNRVWINQGNQQGGEAGQFQNRAGNHGFQSNGVAIADLEEPASADAFLAKDGVNEIWSNDGTGAFTLAQQLTGSEASSSDVALGQFDANPGLDAFVTNAGANEVWLNDGGTFTLGQNDLGDGASHEVALGDINGDGNLDAYVANGTTFFQQDELWLGNGTGGFTLSAQNLDGEWNEGAALADLDGDDDLDLFLAAWFGADSVWINQGNAQGGTLGVLQDSGQQLSGNNSTDITLLDIDGDTDLDAIVGKWTLADEIWQNNGSGQFTKLEQVLGDGASYEIAAGDLDGDMDSDLFVANAGVNQVWIKGGLGLPGAWFDVEVRQNPAGQSIYPWSQTGNAILPIRLGFPAPEALEISAHLKTENDQTTKIIDFAQGEQLGSLIVPNPAPPISETVTISLTVNNSALERHSAISELVNPLDLTFVAVQNGPADCILCLIDWILKTVGFQPSFWQLHHVQLPTLEATLSWSYYNGLFQSNADELTSIILLNPELLWQSYEVLQVWTPAVVAAGEGQGAAMTISEGMVEEVNNLMSDLSEQSNPQLALRLTTEQQILELDSLAGLSMNEALQRIEDRVQGIVYFPVTFHIE